MHVMIAALFGAVIGSFLNVLVFRKGTLSLAGRSHCLSCGSAIRWYDNIPIISWLMLRGRCRMCGSHISAQYVVVEIVTALLFALFLPRIAFLYSYAPVLQATLVVGYAITISLAVAIAVYDARHTIIPDRWVYTFDALAFMLALGTAGASMPMILLAGPLAALPLFLLWLVSGGRWMGLGDAKLALGIGWTLGAWYGPLSVFLAFVIGSIVSLLVLLPLPRIVTFLKKRGIARLSNSPASLTMTSEVAFGPFLVAAYFIVWLLLLYRIPLPF